MIKKSVNSDISLFNHFTVRGYGTVAPTLMDMWFHLSLTTILGSRVDSGLTHAKKLGARDSVLS